MSSVVGLRPASVVMRSELCCVRSPAAGRPCSAELSAYLLPLGLADYDPLAVVSPLFCGEPAAYDPPAAAAPLFRGGPCAVAAGRPCFAN